VEALRQRRTEDVRAEQLDLSSLITVAARDVPRRFEATLPIQRQHSALGDRLHDEALPVLEAGGTATLAYDISNADRSFGARLGGAVGARWGAAAPPGRVTVELTGVAGQSFGAFLTDGVSLHLAGEANDYVCKSMGGGRVVISAPANDAGDPVLAGNTVLYGATGGQLFVAGRAGERFAVRNSGATAVVEGIGDHGCEYMTGGTVVVLGVTGRNLGAGMSGGVAYVYDDDTSLPSRVNTAMVRFERLTRADAGPLHTLITQHAELTGSARARALLDDWAAASNRFWRIAPIPPVVERDVEDEEKAEIPSPR
jgi:glutamate synthase domain-containing protein 3